MTMTEQTPDSSPSPVAAKPKRWRRYLLIAGLLVLTMAALVLWPLIDDAMPKRDAPFPVSAPVAVQTTVPVPALPPAVAVPAGVPALVAPDVAALEERLSRLEKSSADAAAVLRLMDRLDRVEGAVRDVQNRRKGDAALVLSLALLKEAVDRGAPFDTELRAVKVLAPDDADIAKLVNTLKPRSAAGIPARTVLIGRFGAMEAAVIRADTLPSIAGDGLSDWQHRALERVLTVFTLRREDGEIDGGSTPAIMARARMALDHNDWADAVRQMETLHGEAAKAAQIWQSDAKARLEADQAIADVAADAVAAAGAKL